MSDYPSPFGSLSDGSTLLGENAPSGPGAPTPPPPRRGWVPVVVIAAIAVVALVMVAGAALLLLSGGDDSSDDTPAARTTGPPGTEDHSDERDVQPAPAPTPEEPAEPSSPSEPERASILSAKGTAAALSAIRKAAGNREAVTLRIDPDRVTAIVKGKVLVYSRDGGIQDLPGPGTTTPNAFSLGDVDPAAPSRINAAVREKGKQVEYLVYVVNPVSKDVTWVVVTKDGKNYSADPSGRRLCKLAFSC